MSAVSNHRPLARPFTSGRLSSTATEGSAVHDLLSGRSPSDRWGVYRSVGDDGPVGRVGRGIEKRVFRDAYGLETVQMAEEFGPYDERSVWSVIVHHPSSSAVGAVRSIVGPPSGLKFVADLASHWGLTWQDAAERARVDPGATIVEACTYSVVPEWRTADRGWPAKVALAVQLHLMEEVGAAASVQVINPRVLRIYRQWNVPFVSIDSPVDIDGFPFVPAFVPTVVGSPWLRSKDQEFVDLVQRRDESGRGGTRLASIDLGGSDASRLDQRLVTAPRPGPGDGAAHRP